MKDMKLGTKENMFNPATAGQNWLFSVCAVPTVVKTCCSLCLCAFVRKVPAQPGKFTKS